MNKDLNDVSHRLVVCVYTVTHPSEFGFVFIFEIKTHIVAYFVRIRIRIRNGNLRTNDGPCLTGIALTLLRDIHSKLLNKFAERICDTTYPISSSPYYSEDIHTKITHGITQRSHDPRII